MNRTQIREIFLRNGFSIKPGCDDLKSYVYEAAEELLFLAEVERLSSAQDEQYPPCDFCGVIPDHHPWHGSGMFKGADSPHIHACNGCRHLLPAPDVSALVEALEENKTLQTERDKLRDALMTVVELLKGNTKQGHVHAEQTHIVNGVEIPDLRVVPEHGDSYYLVDPTVPELTSLYKFTGTVIDKIWVGRGLAYQPTEEGRRAATLHSKAWLGIVMGDTTMSETGDDEYVSAESFGTLQAKCDTLAKALEELINLMEDTRQGEYAPDSFTTQPARIALDAYRKRVGGV